MGLVFRGLDLVLGLLVEIINKIENPFSILAPQPRFWNRALLPWIVSPGLVCARFSPLSSSGMVSL